MATEILVNDGGAPARILPYTAGAALTAGDAVTMGAVADLTVVKATAANMVPLGYALTDCDSGDICSIITGKGVIINANCIPTTKGFPQMIGAVAGQLAKATPAGAAAGQIPCAMVLKILGESGNALGVADLWRVQTL
jgi:sulfite exporter TauE/SafE